MNYHCQILLLSLIVSPCLIGAKRHHNPSHFNAPTTGVKKPLDLSLPTTAPVNKTASGLNLEPEKNTEKPNIFTPHKKNDNIKLNGKLIMSPETEKRRSTVDGAGVTLDMKL